MDELLRLRAQIDEIDAQIIEIFQRRMDVSAGVARYKLSRGLPVLDASREEQKLRDIAAACRPELAEYVTGLYREIFALSRQRQQRMLDAAGARFGLLGEKLGHSYSPQIHALLHGNEYKLYEVAPEALGRFLQNTDLRGMNVTIPYKKAVIPFCASLSDAARRIGSVNTLVRTPEGWRGENTDYYGFKYMLSRAGVDVRGKKAVIFGSGGASLTVRAVLEDAGAHEVVTVSRSGENNYENLSRHAGAAVAVNATPVGMYPNNGVSAADLRALPGLEAVLDLVYNPARTALLLQAQELGIPCENGLSMLVAQAKRAAELFTGEAIDDGKIGEITRALRAEMRNIVLIGMPGCGKSSVGRALARRLGRELFDADALVERAAGMSIPEIFEREGEEGFRRRETAALSELGKRSGCVISCGGGCVTRPENLPLLRQNGALVWIKRDLALLPSAGRPLSRSRGVQELYEQRRALYESFADFAVENDAGIDACAEKIVEALK